MKMKYTKEQIEKAIAKWQKVLEQLKESEEDTEEMFDGFFDDNQNETSLKYFVVVMADKNTKANTFTFIEAKNETDAKNKALNQYKNVEVLLVKEEKHDATSILKSIGIEKTTIRK